MYIILTFFIILPQLEPAKQNIYRISVFLNAALITIPILFQSYMLNGFVPLAITILMVSSAVLAGRWPTYLFVLMTTGVQILLERTGFIEFSSSTWLTTLFILIVTALVTETITIMKKAISIQLQRLETLNRIARDLSSSLEMHQVIALVSNAIQTTLDADTYYLGLMNGDSSIRLELLYDDGDFFTNTEIDLDNSLAGWVVSNGEALLLRNVTSEAREKLGIRVSTIGQPKLSHSWMGVPLEASGRVFGVVAVASYLRNQYSQSDLELLQNVTQQAAMALDNAAHHAVVEDQSRKDTLTSTINHGAFINTLASEIADAKTSGQPLSLIMLDIDKFKIYNDNFGHLVGDQVLIALCDAIRQNIKCTDSIGRWGGEEFIIALPRANAAQAIQVANRIRRAIGEISLFSRDQVPVPAPTICQGISVFPEEADEIVALIDLADQRLYEAKERGRNQIEPEQSTCHAINEPVIIQYSEDSFSSLN
ncbi:MAG TPA: sensor domain-containing diguanylate cyclase [Longilinea sp.]|nr:sensor domain-containing diguanylate cyclase [Longilinea sp.]